MRVGQGFDVHAFGDGDSIILGGERIPCQHGLVAHSDGDVLIHALVDALLGAAALGDIGRHFPDSDPQFRNIDSRRLLRLAIDLLAERGYTLGNADMTIVAQAPKMAPHIDAMRKNLAADMQCHVDQVGIKATTTENLGFTGRGEGIACLATVLIESNTD